MAFRLKLVPSPSHFNFMKWRQVGFAFSAILTYASLVVLFVMGLNLGIDLKGGLMIEARTLAAPDLGAMRSVIGALDLGEVGLQQLGTDREVLIRLPQQAGGEAANQELANRVKVALEGAVGAVEYRRVEFVGPQVSGELIVNGALAVGLAIAAMLLYIWIRFEWQFGVGTTLALVFDAVSTLGFFSLLQLEFNLPIVAAILTTIGYSMNDKVVIFDRVRENLRKFRSMPLVDLLNHSINDTLARTINTSFTTLIAVLALLFFGGDVLREFNLAMTWGVFIGTFSSMYIAAPALLYLSLNRGAIAREPAGATAASPAE
jgi:preprotein translocase subunit SecF